MIPIGDCSLARFVYLLCNRDVAIVDRGQPISPGRPTLALYNHVSSCQTSPSTGLPWLQTFKLKITYTLPFDLSVLSSFILSHLFSSVSSFGPPRGAHNQSLDFNTDVLTGYASEVRARSTSVGEAFSGGCQPVLVHCRKCQIPAEYPFFEWKKVKRCTTMYQTSL